MLHVQSVETWHAWTTKCMNLQKCERMECMDTYACYMFKVWKHDMHGPPNVWTCKNVKELNAWTPMHVTCSKCGNMTCMACIDCQCINMATYACNMFKVWKQDMHGWPMFVWTCKNITEWNEWTSMHVTCSKYGNMKCMGCQMYEHAKMLKNGMHGHLCMLHVQSVETWPGPHKGGCHGCIASPFEK